MQHPSVRKKKVLLVDDQPEVARALSLPLCRHCEVIQAHSAEQGASLLSGDLAAVLTDYRMPGKNGLWLLAESRERFPRVFRAMVSGTPPDDLELHLESGLVQAFSMKPELPATLLTALRVPAAIAADG